jgi:hypothetical protein
MSAIHEITKQYAERDAMALEKAGGYYSRHVSAMTAEGLHSKSDIAAELAYRDMLIDALTTERNELRLIAAERDELLAKLKEKAELLRGCYAADHKRQKRMAELESALSSLYESSKLVSVGQYDQEQHDIAVSKAAAALKEDKTC